MHSSIINDIIVSLTMIIGCISNEKTYFSKLNKFKDFSLKSRYKGRSWQYSQLIYVHKAEMKAKS